MRKQQTAKKQDSERSVPASLKPNDEFPIFLD
jgi:hypothetical protein